MLEHIADFTTWPILTGILVGYIANRIMRHAGTFQIPTYAIPMLEYGDTTGLTDLDIELVNGFIEANFPHGYVVDWTGIDEPYFASHPEFGIAAEVVEADFYHA
jgi:hypothetical protein